MTATLADVCVVACAEAWRGDGEILASPMGTIPTLGARLAALTFEPDLVLSDGEAFVIANPLPVGPGAHPKVVEGWLPYRSVFDVVWSGRRHVMMGASQVGRDGSTNISCIGDWARPKAQLLGARGAPGNTANHATSYFVPKHSTRVFVEKVDMVSGVGFPHLRRVVTDLAVLDLGGPESSFQIVSVHPGVEVATVIEATGFPLHVPSSVPTTREPTGDELRVLNEVLDPQGLRANEVGAR